MRDGVEYKREYKSWRVRVIAANLLYTGFCESKDSALDLYRILHEESGK